MLYGWKKEVKNMQGNKRKKKNDREKQGNKGGSAQKSNEDQNYDSGKENRGTYTDDEFDTGEI